MARWTETLPRPASLDGDLVLPSMRRWTWVRATGIQIHRSLTRLGQARPGRRGKRVEDLAPEEVDGLVGELAVAQWEHAFTCSGVQQMIGFLGDFATDKGEIGDVGLLLGGYAAHFGVNERTAYRHWRAVRELGLVRQTVHSAYERGARYVLTFPPARLPDGLPDESHAHASQITSRNLPSLQAAASLWDEHSAALLDGLGDAELVRYGSARCQNPDTVPARTAAPTPGQDHAQTLRLYWCQALPLIARGSPPSPDPASRCRPDRPGRGRSGGGISEEERARAIAVLTQCRPAWASQGLTAPHSAELAPLAGLVALALRHATPGDVHVLLTERIGSARDLPGLVRWRLQKTLRYLRRRASVPADETGALYAVKAQARANRARELLEATGQTRADVRAAVEAARERRRAEEAQRAERRRALAESWPQVATPPPASEVPRSRD